MNIPPVGTELFYTDGQTARHDEANICFWRRHLRNCAGSYVCRYTSGDEMEKDEMVGARSTYGGEEGCIQGLGGET